MKARKVLIAMSLVGAILVIGCQEQQIAGPNPIDKSAVNRAIVDTYSDLAIQNAIIAQHTIYPYHFVANSVDLNELGMHDLSVLIEHYKQNPGEITLPQGSVEAIMYQARAQMIYEKLLAAGIPQNKIEMTNGMPGGEGMPSTMVIEILEKSKQSAEPTPKAMQVQF